MERAAELMSEEELVRALDESEADLARRQAYHLRLIAALDNTGHAEKVGARNLTQYLQYRYRLDHYRAHRDVQLARALPKYPAISSRLDALSLRPAQAEAIVLELEKTPNTVPVPDLECAERELAALTHLAPSDLRKAAVASRNILDTDGPEPEEHKAAARETLTLASVDRGVKFKGYLANENAELFRSLITTGARPHKTVDGTPDPRSREKRQADALTTTLTLAATALDAGVPSPTIPRPTTNNGSTTDPAHDPTHGSSHGAPADSGQEAAARSGGEVVPGFGAKANITVTIDLEDLKAATANAIGQTVYSNGLSAATIRRLACDANVIPIVLGSQSEPLDVGRRERLVTKGIRRALNTRDRGCVVCGAPPVMCDAHHLISWIDGGPTALSNLVLLCRRDHTDLHKGHWNITITNDVVHVARPAWADVPPPAHLRPPAATTEPPARSEPPDRFEPPGQSEPPDRFEPPGQSELPGRSEAPDRFEPPGQSELPGRSEALADDPACPQPRAVDRSGAWAAASESLGTATARLDRSADERGSADIPTARTATQAAVESHSSRVKSRGAAVEPWNGPAVPAASATAARSGRWKSDDTTLAEAARFAVWGDGTTTEPGTGPPSFATI